MRRFEIVVVILYVVTSALIFFMLKCFMSPEQTLNNGDWVGFLGSYIGGMIGGLGTLIAMVFTIQNALDIGRRY